MSDPYAGIGAADPYAGIGAAAPAAAPVQSQGPALDNIGSRDAIKALSAAQSRLESQIKSAPASVQADARRRFNADPRIQQLRQSAGKLNDYSLQDLVSSKLTMGLTDKAAPLVAGAIDYARGKGFTYQQHQAEVDQARANYQAQHSVADWATLPLNLMGGGAGGEAAKLTLGGMAKAGAQAGAVAGVGQSRGTLKDQALQTAGSAAGGAVLAPAIGTLAPAVVGGARNLTNRAVSAVTGKAAPVGPTRSGQILLKTLAEQGQTPTQAASAMMDAQANGVPMALMDTGDEARGLASGLSRKPGPGRQLIREVVVPRQEAQTERVQAAVNRDLGPTVGVATEAQKLDAQGAASARPLYEKARAHGKVNDPTIAALAEHSLMQDAINGGRQIHADETFLANARGEEPPAPLPETGHDVQSLDYAKKALDRKIDAAYSGDSAAKAQLPFLKDLRSTLLEKLDAEVPDYAAARAAYAGPQQNKEALLLGQKALTKSGDDIAAMTSKMGPGEIEHFKLGLRSAIVDAANAKGDYADTAKALIGTPKKRAALAQVFGGEKGLDRFIATLNQEKELAATHARVNTGSPTAANLADDANASNLTGVAANAGARFLKGHGIVSNGIATVGDLIKYGSGEAGKRTVAELAAGLSETDPKALAAAFKAANRAAAAQRAARKSNAALGKLGVTAGARQAGTIASLFAPSQ